MNPRVDFFFNKDGKWKQEFAALRKLVLDCGLTEELKWGVPCYMAEAGNIVLIHGFKNYCALLFPKGALLQDPERILIQQSEHVRAARQVRFTDVREIELLESTLKAYIYEAIEIEKAGLNVPFRQTSDLQVPVEFQQKLEEIPGLKSAFSALTPGRQRGYLLYFTKAKQAKTRSRRIEKCLEQIFAGKGLNDK